MASKETDKEESIRTGRKKIKNESWVYGTEAVKDRLREVTNKRVKSRFSGDFRLQKEDEKDVELQGKH